MLIWFEAEEQLEQQHRRAGRPRLRAGRRRIDHGGHAGLAREASEDLGQPVVEMNGRLDHAAQNLLALMQLACARQAGRSE